MSELQTVRISVCDSVYTIFTDSEPVTVQRYAAMLDARMREIMRSGRGISQTQAAVLCALRFLEDAQTAQDEAAKLRSEYRNYLEDSARAKTERDAALRELARYKGE
ncbi:MAG: cell division protein ZapA [Clostridia bacterium]|nr:cell division protein ZapA [Clostridia bacterium]